MENSKLIPLRNRKKIIVAEAIIDIDDFEKVNKYKWHTMPARNDNLYVQGTVNNRKTLLHHLVLGKPVNNLVIDHINGDGLDNRKSNLRFVTKSVNSQNKNLSVNKTSKYIGVCFNKARKKFEVACGKYKLGFFEDEKEGAIKYDICAYLTCHKDAKTNKLISYDESLKYNLDDIVVKRQIRDLPPNISFHKTHKKYFSSISYKGIHYISKETNNLEEAISDLEKNKIKIQKIKDKTIEEHNKKPITRNVYGQAVILFKDEEIIVDDNLWHELSLKNWWIDYSNGYATGTVNKKDTSMHRYIYGLINNVVPEIVDHINNNRKDNRISNLRENTSSGNNHNKSKTKNASSKYFGVYYSKRDDKWLASITLNNKQYHIGLFKYEIQAAKAYNIKATELYGDKANLNIFQKLKIKYL